MKNTPSIPTRNQVYGYEYDDLGNLIMQTKPETIEEESAQDRNYNYIVTQKKGGFSFGKQKREAFKNPQQDLVVGPGQQFSHEGEVIRKKKTGVI